MPDTIAISSAANMVKTTGSWLWLPLFTLTLLACSPGNSSSSSQVQPRTQPPALSETPSEKPDVPRENDVSETNTESGRECLPVVAAECGCVYSCGLGLPQGDGYKVRHEFWKDMELDARIAQWCVGEDCTNAFHAKILCGGICAPKAADSNCGFVDGRCVSVPELGSVDAADSMRAPGL